VITLHQFARVWDIPSPSPFCAKVETYLRMAGIPYEVADAIPPTAPRGKLPYVVDGSETISDSRVIIEHLKERHGADLDRELTRPQQAESLAFQRMIEDDLHWAMMYSRWYRPENWAANKQAIFGVLPPVVRDGVAWIARRSMRGQIRGQGAARRDEAELFELGCRDIDALSDFLAERPYFMGDVPTTLDACAFGMLINLAWCPIESPLKTRTLERGNLVSFCERIRDRHFDPI
jgi:glutathione S-transferase